MCHASLFLGILKFFCAPYRESALNISMEPKMTHNAENEIRLVEQARQGDQRALAIIFSKHEGRLRRMIQLRLNRKLWGRIDAADVLQESYLEIARQFPKFTADSGLPLFLWMRHIVGQQIIMAHRYHLGTQKRDAGKEIDLNAWGAASATSEAIAVRFLGKLTSPSQSIMKVEARRRVQDALDQMSPLDREILVLRHFEQLSNKETAQALEIQPSAASSRYVRALDHLQTLLGDAR